MGLSPSYKPILSSKSAPDQYDENSAAFVSKDCGRKYIQESSNGLEAGLGPSITLQAGVW